MQEKDVKSLFDYDIITLRLNESRSADWYCVENRVISYFCNHCKNKNILKQIIKLFKDINEDNNRQSFEGKLNWDVWSDTTIYKNEDVQAAWRAAFIDLYGSNAFVCPNETLIVSMMKNTGKDAIIFEHNYAKYLQRLGCPSWKTINDDSDEDWIVGEKTSVKYDDVWNKLDRFNTTKKPKPRYKTFKQFQKSEEKIHGKVKDDVIYINEDVLGSIEEEKTLIEEFAHYLSEQKDETRSFQNFLIDIIHEVI